MHILPTKHILEALMNPKELIFSETGIVTSISNFDEGGCTLLFEVQTEDNTLVNFIINPNTYFFQQEPISTGMSIIGFFDANAPVPLIYPPRYQALVVAAVPRRSNLIFDWFNQNLINYNGTLKLNISPNTEIIMANGQPFHGSAANHYLLVQYSTTTRSIPAQTTPSKIVVMCG